MSRRGQIGRLILSTGGARAPVGFCPKLLLSLLDLHRPLVKSSPLRQNGKTQCQGIGAGRPVPGQGTRSFHQGIRSPDAGGVHPGGGRGAAPGAIDTGWRIGREGSVEAHDARRDCRPSM